MEKRGKVGFRNQSHSLLFLIKPKPKKLYNWRNITQDSLFGRCKRTETDAFWFWTTKPNQAYSNVPEDKFLLFSKYSNDDFFLLNLHRRIRDTLVYHKTLFLKKFRFSSHIYEIWNFYWLFGEYINQKQIWSYFGNEHRS